MGPIEQKITDKLVGQLAPDVLDIANESPMHGLPKEAEKHFRMIIVSEKFSGRTRIERHRIVNEILAEELKGPIHALTIQAFTREEWTTRNGTTFNSPQCLGGGKKERGR